MSRTNKGGARLRTITGLAAALAIVAGVYAGYAHKPMTASCSFQPSSIFEGKVVRVNCVGLSASTPYQLGSDSLGLWDNASDLGSGDGSSAANAAGFASGPVTFTTNTLGTASIYVNTVADATQSATQLEALDNMGNSLSPQVLTPAKVAYDLSFTVNQSPGFADPERLQVSGLVGSETIKIGPMDETNETADLSGWQDSGSGSVSGSGTSGSPYLYPNSSPYSFSLSASSGAIDTYVQTNNGTMSTIPTRIAIYDNSGTLIGVSPQIDVAGH